MATGELDTGRGCNQVRTLQQAGATRWSSYFGFVTRLIEMFGAARTVLENIIDNAIDSKVRLQADSAYNAMISFDFVFALHLLYEVMGITYILCQDLQRKLIDILNAMSFVSISKVLFQKLREDGWNTFF